MLTFRPRATDQKSTFVVSNDGKDIGWVSRSLTETNETIWHACQLPGMVPQGWLEPKPTMEEAAAELLRRPIVRPAFAL